ncbi:dual specificity protein phosphatase family protein [Sporosarcina siberiensis]|uniref:Dual specificity protein phosphatase family protein n=1 Tax=Sporosarcina siberiensis TaxID=1365606 RepID=A0ABW4SDM6_9BACL
MKTLKEKLYQELIPGRIFIGGIDAIDDLLSNENIDVIYDLRAEVNHPLSTEISVHQPILDVGEQQDNSITSTTKTIAEAYRSGKNIYFHCNTGRGRAGTIAAATLLELGLANTVNDAEQKALEIRPQINIKPQFKEALTRIYEDQTK